MERSTSSLSYNGSISDAINVARREKKLFAVYISGEDENSVSLEQSTLLDIRVVESISKHCVFLHLMQGTVDASQFSVIYPQKSVPSISAVGHNGVMLWQHEGYITAENFVDGIEKAWAALQMQETAAALLAAALASKKPEPSSPSSSSSASFGEGSSSITNIPSTLTDKRPEGSEAGPSTHSGLIGEQGGSETRPKKDTNLDEETSSQSVHVNEVNVGGDEQSFTTGEAGQELLCPVRGDVDSSSIESMTSNNEEKTSAPQQNINSDDSKTTINSETGTGCGSGFPQGSCEIVANEEEERTEDKRVEPNVIKSNDICLSIRLPNGASLQTKFTVTDTLRSVKSYIDDNQIGLGSYDLAVPYPRKVFSEQDLNKALSELGLANREALIVVPHRHATESQRGQPSPSQYPKTVSETESNDTSQGYFGYAKRILSYMNPFSYLGSTASSSDSEPVPSESIWQYRPNPSHQNRLSASDVSHRPYSPNLRAPSSGDTISKERKRTSKPFGSNIHTLRDGDDEDPSSDRNVFWNGNSTQFGGGDSK